MDTSRRLHGRRGLKFCGGLFFAVRICRRLHGRRGLKSYDEIIAQFAKWSPPSRAAWIEMVSTPAEVFEFVSPPSRAAWIEIELVAEGKIAIASPPSRAAWIEIIPNMNKRTYMQVAAFTGGVD